MKAIRKEWFKKYGYNPIDSEILYLYQCGDLRLSDKQEDDLLKYFNL